MDSQLEILPTIITQRYNLVLGIDFLGLCYLVKSNDE